MSGCRDHFSLDYYGYSPKEDPAGAKALDEGVRMPLSALNVDIWGDDIEKLERIDPVSGHVEAVIPDIVTIYPAFWPAIFLPGTN